MKTTQPHEEPHIYGKQVTYYERFFRRSNAFKETFYNLFFNICSWPRLVLEVFLRRDIGERYFSFGTVVVIFILMMVAAMQINALGGFINRGKTSAYMSIGLVIFASVFLYHGWERRKEIKALASVYDFERFSLATGETRPEFDRFTTDRRKLTTIYEPAAGFIAGLACLLILQLPVAFILMSCSVIYSLSYVAAYHQGDNYLMDKIDERICREDLWETFVENTPYGKTRGAEFFGHKSKDRAARRRAAAAANEAEDIAFEVVP